MEMPGAAEFTSLDTVAECYDECSDKLCAALWDRVSDDGHEAFTEAAAHGFNLTKEGSDPNNVSAHWETFSEAEQAELIALLGDPPHHQGGE